MYKANENYLLFFPAGESMTVLSFCFAREHFGNFPQVKISLKLQGTPINSEVLILKIVKKGSNLQMIPMHESQA